MSSPSPSPKTPPFGTMARSSGAAAPSVYARGSHPFFPRLPEDDVLSPITQVTPLSRREGVPASRRGSVPAALSIQKSTLAASVDVPTLVNHGVERKSGTVEIARVTAPPERQPGDVLAGRYRLVRVLGQGGMGKVWEAESLTLGIPVAVKLLRRKDGIAAAQDRLEQEARAAARVTHPASVRVLDFGTTNDGEAFLVMERLIGIPLSRHLANAGPLDPLTAVRMALPIADVLAAAHRAGVIHCDLKPGNILLVPGLAGPSPRLIDFGIARLLDPTTWRAPRRPRMLLGSLTYMAPEQVRSEGMLGPGTDIWGLCLMLYELCTGRRPFRADASIEVIEAITWQELDPPPELRDHEALWSILGRGLQKDPDDRWPSMDALGTALARWAAAQGAEVDSTGTSLAHRWLGA